MKIPKFARMLVAGLAWGALSLSGAQADGPAPGLDKASCLTCHDAAKAKIEVPGAEGAKRALRAVPDGAYAKSVHAKLECVSCHTDITDAKANHAKPGVVAKVECGQCHVDLWAKTQKEGNAAKKPRLGVVAQNVDAYKASFHARPNKEDNTRPNAVCTECHDTHTFAIPAKDSPEHKAWRLDIPKTCGAKCHSDELEEFSDSVHGKAIAKGDIKAAVCVDCHSSHDIANTSKDIFKTTITQNCGNCHEENFKSYRATYHGQVNRLGFGYTAKCHDCHGSHGILKVDDPASKMHEKNRLKTCQTCHNDKKPGMHTATPGYVTFGPHANGHDFKKFPEMWITTKFMVALLIGVFAFFWAHSGLWYYREWQDRKEGKHETHVDTSGMNLDEKKFVKRFPWGWRVAHLAFALVTMTLVLSGTSALFADSFWAPIVVKALGGPANTGLIHRIAAGLFVGIFMIHFVYVMQRLLRSKTFRWFGPDSLIPNWKDLADCVGMFKWFVGKGPRPQFERWTYFEKFDYWAVFWGVNIIGWSGLMLAFPHITAKFLPGWIFNVATLVHGEEAFLAAVFLFTVHFFNNHFRPDKLPPPDVVMFTGSQSLEEFRREHRAQYDRLVASGELEKYLVDAPSQPFKFGSKVLGLVLIAVGLILLVLVSVGFLGGAG